MTDRHLKFFLRYIVVLIFAIAQKYVLLFEIKQGRPLSVLRHLIVEILFLVAINIKTSAFYKSAL